MWCLVFLLLLLFLGANGFNLGGNALTKGRISTLQKNGQRQCKVQNSMRRRSLAMTDLENTFDVNIPALTALSPHPKLVNGHLDNGLEYVVLPNSIPSDRFEAHLEILSGSLQELESQQGLAHLLEHITYMGAEKRRLLGGTGSKTNAYTDFHHTVFFAGCPNQTPNGMSMLPLAFDALHEVMTPSITEDRLSKERSAVLSEAKMVNKIDYRQECQVLSAMHGENRIPCRFPIGKEQWINAWTLQDVKQFHQRHYRPDNAVLYVIGDIDVESTIDLIKRKFGSLSAATENAQRAGELSEYPRYNMHLLNKHFPPLIHHWALPKHKIREILLNNVASSAKKQETAHLLLANGGDEERGQKIKLSSDLLRLLNNLAIPQKDELAPENATCSFDGNEPGGESRLTVQDLTKPALAHPLRLFQHELNSAYSFHLFAKHPIEALTSEEALKRELLRKIVATAMQTRLNVQRETSMFNMVDFSYLNWPRDACAVCSIDLTVDPALWKEATKIALQEVKRMSLYGLSESEFLRMRVHVLNNIVMSTEERSHEDVLTEVMEGKSCGHTYLQPKEKLRLSEQILEQVTLEEANAMAKELCQHIDHLVTPAPSVQSSGIKLNSIRKDSPEDAAVSGSGDPIHVSMVASMPVFDRDRSVIRVTPQEIGRVVVEAVTEPVAPMVESVVPGSLISPDDMKQKSEKSPPQWAPLLEKGEQQAQNSEGVVVRRLSNGLRVNMKPLTSESKKVSIRIYAPGGRLTEDKAMPGALLLGSKTLQEGGACLSFSREEAELFCLDHHIMVEMKPHLDGYIIDIDALTTRGPHGELSGFEAAMQIAHVVLCEVIYEEDAHERAKQLLHEQYEVAMNVLESTCQESIARSLTSTDNRFYLPDHKDIDGIDFASAVAAIKKVLQPGNVEITIVGDVSAENMEAASLKYLGTVPAETAPSFSFKPEKVRVLTLGSKRHLSVVQTDGEERAMGYLAGPAPNNFGLYADGQSVADKIKIRTPAAAAERHKHPLFGAVALQLLADMINRRLFSVVREDHQLTYDTSFALNSQELDTILGNWYTVSVTSSPSQVKEAVRACKKAMYSLYSNSGWGFWDGMLDAAKQSLLHRFSSQRDLNKFWIQQLTGVQMEAMPLKHVAGISDYAEVVRSVSEADIQELLNLFQFSDERMTVCIGVTEEKKGLVKAPAEQEEASRSSKHLSKSSMSTMLS